MTADHPISNRSYSRGIEGSAYAVAIFGTGTRHADSYPTADMDASETRFALQDFIGPAKSCHVSSVTDLRNCTRQHVSSACAQAPHALTCRGPTPSPNATSAMSRRELALRLNNAAVCHIGGRMRIQCGYPFDFVPPIPYLKGATQDWRARYHWAFHTVPVAPRVNLFI